MSKFGETETAPFKESLPLLPLRGMIVFPFMVVPLDVGRDKWISTLEEAMIHDRLNRLGCPAPS